MCQTVPCLRVVVLFLLLLVLLAVFARLAAQTRPLPQICPAPEGARALPAELVHGLKAL